MSVLGVIPVRMASSRFPGKPLAPIRGRPLIQWVCERAAAIPGLGALRVACADAVLVDAVRGLGYEAVLTSPDHPSGTDRVAEAAAGWPGPVLNLQGDEPLIDVDSVAQLMRRFAEQPELKLGTVGLPLSPGDLEHSDRVKVLRNGQGFAVDFQRRLLRPPAGDEEVLRHAGVYLFRAETLRRFVGAAPAARELAEGLEQLRALQLGLPIWVERGRHWGPGVDRPEDLKVVAKLLWPD